ncbi:zinc finger protein ZOP1 [Impatiens glandulifera]|uniref:zinc finger protein ZOP1 n=1 Tax=Impatiens glandulifera TaxID=253017 RepID=UPI001FB1545E|nr:zinc finger protein ZOP1 [Impatiens glandulifera]
MTEYWVSQGNKWCDICKIFISNNPASIRNHELGQRHKDNVGNRLTTMRKDKEAKDKEQKQTEKALEQIEAKAKRSYDKDVSASKDVKLLAAPDEGTGTFEGEWDLDSSSGYYYNKTNGCHYDPNSGFYYTDSLGKWVTREEAIVACKSSLKSIQKNKSVFTKPSSILEKNHESGPAPGRVVSLSTPLNPMRSVKGAAPSSLTVNKRKREDVKAKKSVVSGEEASALKAREAARKRVEEREKSFLGLYK